MSDSTMENIKNGKGLEPLQNTTQPLSTSAGLTTEQRAEHGTTIQKFSQREKKTEGK